MNENNPDSVWSYRGWTCCHPLEQRERRDDVHRSGEVKRCKARHRSTIVIKRGPSHVPPSPGALPAWLMWGFLRSRDSQCELVGELHRIHWCWTLRAVKDFLTLLPHGLCGRTKQTYTDMLTLIGENGPNANFGNRGVYLASSIILVC